MLEIPEIDNITAAFPANATSWMPTREAIPDKFAFRPGRESEWNEIASAWFFKGLPKTVEFYPRKGVDPEKALRVIQATLSACEPKHEHKEEAVAYMLSEWFEKIKGWKR